MQKTLSIQEVLSLLDLGVRVQIYIYRVFTVLRRDPAFNNGFSMRSAHAYVHFQIRTDLGNNRYLGGQIFAIGGGDSVESLDDGRSTALNTAP